MIRKFYLHTNETRDTDFSFTGQVEAYLRDSGRECVRVRFPEDRELLCREAHPEEACLISMGGDGTVLRASEVMRGTGIPILGINLGHMGYLAEIEQSGWKDALDQVLRDEVRTEDRMMLAGSHPRKEGLSGDSDGDSAGPQEEAHLSLNDIVIIRKGPLRVLEFNVYVDDLLLYNFNADGLILATPTGSTAYNLSAGGPIVEPTARLIVLTLICPHMIGNRSIILSSTDRIEIELRPERNEVGTLDGSAEVYYDGRLEETLRAGDRMSVFRSEQTVQLLRLDQSSFLQTVHKKMQP